MAPARCANQAVSIDFREVPQYKLSRTVPQRFSGGFAWVVSRGWFRVGGFAWVVCVGVRWVARAPSERSMAATELVDQAISRAISCITGCSLPLLANMDDAEIPSDWPRQSVTVPPASSTINCPAAKSQGDNRYSK